MKGRKVTVFWVNSAALVAFFVCTALFAPASLSAIGPVVVWALIGNGAVYTGGNVLHAWQKSANFRPELKE